jgi:hypothetical protein
MTSELFPLALNELLGRPLILSFNFRICFSSMFAATNFTSLVLRSVSNARINRAHIQLHYGQVHDERQANLRSG